MATNTKHNPRDFKQEFEQYIKDNPFSQQDYAAFLMTAKIIVFERDKAYLLGTAINLTRCDTKEPRILHRLRKHDIL